MAVAEASPSPSSSLSLFLQSRYMLLVPGLVVIVVEQNSCDIHLERNKREGKSLFCTRSQEKWREMDGYRKLCFFLPILLSLCHVSYSSGSLCLYNMHVLFYIKLCLHPCFSCHLKIVVSMHQADFLTFIPSLQNATIGSHTAC